MGRQSWEIQVVPRSGQVSSKSQRKRTWLQQWCVTTGRGQGEGSKYLLRSRVWIPSESYAPLLTSSVSPHDTHIRRSTCRSVNWQVCIQKVTKLKSCITANIENEYRGSEFSGHFIRCTLLDSKFYWNAGDKAIGTCQYQSCQTSQILTILQAFPLCFCPSSVIATPWRIFHSSNIT